MAKIQLEGVPVETAGDLPAVGTKAPAFTVVNADLEDVRLADFAGQRVVLNIFPSLDTGICATSVRTFNKLAEQFVNTAVICVSMDLPFALGRFCGAEGIQNVVTASAFRSDFGETYGVRMVDGALAGLLSRSVVIVDTDGTVIYTEQVPEIKTEPNYEAAAQVLA
ncbi:thiol peroxidase [Actinobaculum suis]|uniref:thiol peroxidase n=1 Tax=Actinobaculum suis TaxID=1657 RepID=UPI00066FE650|nr:thiol peroxidase [Actinobaculum suis]KMY22988.1 peroxidase [Actinobaculum suis]OCA94606.1 lipid hydroperoxide peroxidase [Actinobaculum suis]OCA95017.1 lipid hydroperoxide peroxidase [Actinobaculum suis]